MCYNNNRGVAMKIKRSMLIVALIALFIGCYAMMNKHYDELARYPHTLNEQQRELVLHHLNTDEINTLISWKIEPKEFLPYIEVDGFVLENTLWYDEMANTTKEKVSKEFIVAFINKYKEQMNFNELQYLLANYSYNELIRFFDEGDLYQKSARLIPNPSDIYTMIANRRTLYTYEPKDLVSIGSLPHSSIVPKAYDILVKKEVLEPLQQLCKAAEVIDDQPCSGMRVVAGYLSYEDQVMLYEQALEEYDAEELSKYWDAPGHSEYQLGYSLILLPNEIQPKVNHKEQEKTEAKEELGREQEAWLKENAYKYGFIIRYPLGQEDITGKEHQPFALRYVGKELAKTIYEQDIALEKADLG